MGKSLLVYNLLPKTIWKDVTTSLLSCVPHDDIVIHVSMPLKSWFFMRQIKNFLYNGVNGNKIKAVYFSQNIKSRGESIGFNKVRKNYDLSGYDILTYIHSKGTSKKKKNTGPIRDWTEVMRYFVVERHDLCVEAFSKGYWLYGINLSKGMHPKESDKLEFPDTRFIYGGNFVSCSLKHLLNEVQSAPVKPSYFGVERFWGAICPEDKAFCVHETNTDNYNQNYPPEMYK